MERFELKLKYSFRQSSRSKEAVNCAFAQTVFFGLRLTAALATSQPLKDPTFCARFVSLSLVELCGRRKHFSLIDYLNEEFDFNSKTSYLSLFYSLVCLA